MFSSNFINKSLFQVNDVIKYILTVKNKDKNSATPGFIDVCYDNYFPKKDTTFTLTETKSLPNTLPESVIFNAIQEYLATMNNGYRDVTTFCNDIIVGVFCVFNISRKANNPPPIPYVDISVK